MTMVPRTGPFSASSALLRTSWYQRGKSSARGVSTGALAMEPEGSEVRTGSEAPHRSRPADQPTSGHLHHNPDLSAGIWPETRVDFSGMAIDVRELRALPLDPEIEEELTNFEDGARRYLAGEIDDDVFRVFRLNQGIYGQRQGGYNQMLRVKIPYGQVEPDQLEVLGYLSETYSRGWGHLTTRQNVQFHFVQLEQVAEALR